MKKLSAIILALALTRWARAGDIQYDVEYANPDNNPQFMDYRIPEGKGPFPALIFVHGGGWGGGDKEHPTEVQPILDPLYNGHIAWFTINYRTAPPYPYPGYVEDTEAAVQYVKKYAKQFNIDPNKVAIAGESAGGHIVDMVAVRATPDKPERHLAAVVAFYAPNDLVEDAFRRNQINPSVNGSFGFRSQVLNDQTVKILQDASPIAFVTPNLPPFLLVHGTADTSVDYSSSPIWKDALDALGVPCELITIPLGVHVMGNWAKLNPPNEAYKQQVVDWLNKQFSKIDEDAKKPAKPAAAPAPVKQEKVTGLWKNVKGAEGSGIYLVADGTGDSLLAPACAVKWNFDPATAAVHIDYPQGQGRDVPYAGSPEISQSNKDKIANAVAPVGSLDRTPGVRPKVGFYDFHYFPVPDIMISSNGEVYKRQPKEAVDAFLKTKTAKP